MEYTTRVELKALTDSHATVAGYGVVFGGVDLQGETFGPDTDFMPELAPTKLVLYDHAQGHVKAVLGATTKVEADDVGLWVEAELDRHAQYMDAVLSLVEKGALGWSSGSVGHLTQREGKAIKRWPIVEFSLTPTPAEPRTLGVDLIKHLATLDGEFEALLPETDGPSVAQGADEPQTEPPLPILEFVEETTMSEEQQVAQPQGLEVNEDLKLMRGQINDLSDALNQVLTYIQDSPKVKNAGYVTMDGGAADPQIKTFGDFLVAVQRNDTKRLAEVYKTTKALGETGGAAGGFLVPPEFETMLMQVANNASIVRPRATVIPVTTNAGSIPALDQYTAPTAGVGNSAFAGGVVAAWEEEAGTLNSTDPAFKQIEWRVHKLGGYTTVSNELLADSAIAIESLLSALFGRAVAAMEDYAFLRGTGVGQPVGILEADCTIGVTTASDNVFALTDAMNMLAQFWPYAGRTVWIMHPGLIPDLAGSTFGTTGNAMPQIAPREGIGGPNQLAQPLLGYPVLLSEHMPNPNTDDAILADLSAYLIFDRQGLTVSFSEHVAFTTDQGTWRFTKRLDGKPWLKSYITLASPSAYTVSPFLYHND
jgi:HK97 family phage major capsid protein